MPHSYHDDQACHLLSSNNEQENACSLISRHKIPDVVLQGSARLLIGYKELTTLDLSTFTSIEPMIVPNTELNTELVHAIDCVTVPKTEPDTELV